MCGRYRRQYWPPCVAELKGVRGDLASHPPRDQGLQREDLAVGEAGSTPSGLTRSALMSSPAVPDRDVERDRTRGPVQQVGQHRLVVARGQRPDEQEPSTRGHLRSITGHRGVHGLDEIPRLERDRVDVGQRRRLVETQRVAVERRSGVCGGWQEGVPRVQELLAGLPVGRRPGDGTPGDPSRRVPGRRWQSNWVSGCRAALRKNAWPTCSPQMLFIRGLVALPNAHPTQRFCHSRSECPKACDPAGGVPAAAGANAEMAIDRVAIRRSSGRLIEIPLCLRRRTPRLDEPCNSTNPAAERGGVPCTDPISPRRAASIGKNR